RRTSPARSGAVRGTRDAPRARTPRKRTPRARPAGEERASSRLVGRQDAGPDRLHAFDAHGVALEQLLIERLVRSEAPGVIPLSPHGIAHFRERGQAS